jgi:hypothetical protein
MGKKTLSTRAALAVGVIAAALGWLAVVGVVHFARQAVNQIEARRSSAGFNEIAPGGTRD